MTRAAWEMEPSAWGTERHCEKAVSEFELEGCLQGRRAEKCGWLSVFLEGKWYRKVLCRVRGKKDG